MSSTMGLPPRAWAAIEMVANKYAQYGVTPEKILSHDRARLYAWPRQEAYAAIREILRPDGRHVFSLTAIGRMMGGRDHSTVFYGIRNFKKRRLAEAGLTTGGEDGQHYVAAG